MPTGDKAWPHLHPERMARGADHGVNLHPEVKKKAIERLLKADRSRGEAHYEAKITEANVRTIRDRYSKGARIAQLAKDYRFSWPAMAKVVYRKSWAHVS